MGLPSLDNIPSVADLTASFAARKEERLKQEAEKKESERRVCSTVMEHSIINIKTAQRSLVLQHNKVTVAVQTNQMFRDY